MSEEGESDREFGRRILRRGSIPRSWRAVFRVGLFCTGLGTLGLILVMLASGPRNPGIFIAFIVAGPLMIACSLFFLQTVLLFENGAEVRGRWGSGRLAYENVAECTISRDRMQNQHARYRGTWVTLVLKPAKEITAPTVRVAMRVVEKAHRARKYFCQTTYIYQPTELDSLACYISSHIAERLLARVDAGESIPWGPNLAVSRAGLTHTSRREQATIPWENFGGLTTDAKGRTFITRINGDPLRVSLPVKTPNREATAIIVATLSGIPAAPEITPATAPGRVRTTPGHHMPDQAGHDQ